MNRSKQSKNRRPWGDGFSTRPAGMLERRGFVEEAGVWRRLETKTPL